MVIIRKKHVESAEEKDNRLKKEAEEKAGIQDEYQAKGFELVSWVQEHKGLVTGLIVLLLLGGGIFSGYAFYQQRANEEATTQYLAALKDIDSDEAKEGEDKTAKLKKAQVQLQDVASKFSHAKVAKLANLYAGHLALEVNDPQAALQSYQAAFKSMSKEDPLHALAVIGLGYAQERNGDQKSSLTSFESVINSKENVGKDLALFEAARLATDLKENDKAKDFRDRLLKEFPNSVYEKNVKRLAIQ